MSMSTKRRMTWKTGIPFIILCIIIGLLVGWLADRASATEELIPLSDSVASVDTPRQGVRKFKRHRLGRARQHQGYSAQQKDVILDKLMRLQRRRNDRGISARTLTRRGMWRNFTSHDNCFYKVSRGSPSTAVWTCRGSVRRFPGADADWKRRDVRALLCSGVAGISVGGALAAGAGGPWVWAGIGVGWALCVWQQRLEAMADN
jgi:hypothetical protein